MGKWGFDMAVQTPPVQDGTVDGSVADQAAAAVEPLISGPGPVLWGGFAAFIIIFLIVLLLIMRGRLSRPARRRHDEKPAEVFQPAGEDVEIAFEDEPRAQPEPAPEPPRDDADGREAAKNERQEKKEKKERPKPAPFASLFASKKRAEQKTPAAEEPHDDAPVSEKPPAPARYDDIDAELAEARRRAEEEIAEMRRRAEEEAAAVYRQAEESAARALQEAEETRAHILQQAEEAEQARLRAEEEMREATARVAEEIRRVDEERNGAEERAVDFERRKQEAALEQGMQSLASAQESFVREAESLRAETEAMRRDLSEQLERRFAALAETLETRMAAPATAGVGEEGETGGGDAGTLAEMVSRRMTEQREAIDAAIEKLSARIDAFAGGPDEMKALMAELSTLRVAPGGRLAQPMSPEVQLSDIVRNALPQTAYEMRALLSNNRRADCVIRLPHPPGPVAIDASFPVETLHQLYGENRSAEEQAQAENAFRRAVLRHIVDIAERLIVPGETAESAMMFLPSEAMYTELHARFPDLVQDSYRARVWIVSPTSLMATLHTVRAVLRDAHARETAEVIHSEAKHVLAEVDELRRRVAALEEDFDKARHDVRDLASGADQVYRRAETITNSGRALAEESVERGSRRILKDVETELPAADGDHPGGSSPDDDAQPRFPLR